MDTLSLVYTMNYQHAYEGPEMVVDALNCGSRVWYFNRAFGGSANCELDPPSRSVCGRRVLVFRTARPIAGRRTVSLCAMNAEAGWHPPLTLPDLSR